MYFNYRDKWRMWTRERKYTSNTSLGHLVGLPTRNIVTVKTHLRTDFWFNHYCEGFEFKKIKGKVKPNKPIKGYHRYEDGFLIRHCQACGAKMDTEVQDYFSKALELWRLSANPNP